MGGRGPADEEPHGRGRGRTTRSCCAAVRSADARTAIARDDEDEADEEEPVVPISTTKADDRLEPIEARVVPIQATEFVCKNCYLVKHRSQLADKRRMFCRDCA